MAKNGTEADATPELDQISVQLLNKEIAKMEFYKTYDLMTGVRIAATLGGFFGIMVLLVVYKSKCKSRSMSDENLEGVAAGLNRNGTGRRNLSLAGNTCWLSLPPTSQITPADTPTTPPALQVDRFIWDFTSPLHLHDTHNNHRLNSNNIIQATPELTPCASRTSIYNGPWIKENLHVPKIAPLASLSSFGIGSTDRDDHSVGSDSVFLDEELIDTEDEVEGFSTDSDAEKADFATGSRVNSRGSDTSSAADTRRSLRRYSSPNPYLWDKEKNQEVRDKSWRWRRFSGSWKQQQQDQAEQLPLPSTVSLNRETLF